MGDPNARHDILNPEERAMQGTAELYRREAAGDGEWIPATIDDVLEMLHTGLA